MLLSDEELVEHQVDNHAGNRDIHPDGISPAGEAAMAVEFVLKRQRECNQNHGHDDRCEHRMRDQDGKVDRTRPAVPSEAHGSHMKVIVEITGEKDGRRDERRDHCRAVLDHSATFDEVVSDHQQNGGCAVERGVEWWEDVVVDPQVSVQESLHGRCGHAAGCVVLLFTIRNATPKITAVNTARIVRDVSSEN